MNEDLGTVERNLTFAAPRDELWDLLTRPEQLSRWFGAQVEELELRPGGLITFRGPDGRVRQAHVEEIDRPTRLVFRWLPSDDDPANEPPSTVEFRLKDVPEGTRLTVVESRIPAESDPLPGEILSSWGPVLTGDPPPDPPGGPPRILLNA